jgi:hypothetical protein
LTFSGAAAMDEEIEFCRECGMEFADGVEDACPLCGNELGLDDDNEDDDVFVVGRQLDDSERCAECGEWYDNADEWFWSYWKDFDSPKWLKTGDVWCTECILARISKDHPEFSDSGLEPDTFLIWKDALKIGIDLSQKIIDIDDSNSVSRLHECLLSREDIIKWLNSDCPIDEAEMWCEIVDEFEKAMSWRVAGAKPDEVENWLKWDCAPELAGKYLGMGLESAPSDEYKELGISLEDAVLYEINGFSTYAGDPTEYYIGDWLPSGLPAQELVRLRKYVIEHDSEFQDVHEKSQTGLKPFERTSKFWGVLSEQLEQLSVVGLPVTSDNLKKFWGLSSKEILKVIDVGGDVKVAIDVIRNGGTIGNLGIIEKLIDKGVSQSSATLLAKRGFLVKHLKRLEQSNEARFAAEGLIALLNVDSEMRIEEAFEWVDVQIRSDIARLWKQKNFSAQEASKWMKEGFSADRASRWRDTGVKSPSIAKRRQDAGLNP